MENLKMPIVEYLDPTHDYKFHQFKLGSQLLPDGWIRVPEGAEVAVESNELLYFWKDNGLTSWVLDRWRDCSSEEMKTLEHFMKDEGEFANIVWRREQPDVAASMNDIARTAEVHRELNLANELNDLCAEFGCLPGVDRMTWLRDRLRATKKPRGTETLYHYSASINTARGTVAYDGVITFPGRITSIEEYQQARAEIAKDGNVAPEQVNIHSLSVIN